MIAKATIWAFPCRLIFPFKRRRRTKMKSVERTGAWNERRERRERERREVDRGREASIRLERVKCEKWEVLENFPSISVTRGSYTPQLMQLRGAPPHIYKYIYRVNMRVIQTTIP